MAALPKVARYIKNVGQSVVYASVENLKEDMPNIAAIADHQSNKEVYKTIYQGIRDYRTTYSRAVKYLKSTKIYEAGDLAVKSTFEDLKSGKFYNKDRMNEIEDKVAAQMGFGIDDIDGFGGGEDEDFGFGSDDITEGDRLTAGTTMIASMKNAEMISSTIAKSTQAQMKHTEASTNLLYSQNFKLFGELRTDIANFSTRGIQEQVKTNTIMSTIADNQKKFYETATTSLQEIAAYLKETTEMNRNIYGQKQKDSEKKSNKVTISDLIDSNGVLDIKEYGKLVGRNFKAVANEKTGGMLEMLNMGGGDANLLAMFAANPLGMVLQSGLRGAMSNSLRKSMKDFDKTIGGVAGTALARLTNMGKNDDWDANPILKTIGQIFGVNTSVKSSIDPGKFQKGPVPFDGVTRATINQGITGYLARIESALTGGPVRVFNPQTGRWTTAKGLQKDFDSMKKGAINSGTSDIADAMAEYIFRDKRYRAKDRQAKRTIERNFNSFMEALYNKNGDFKLKSYGDYYDWGVESEDMFKFLVDALKATQKTSRGTRMNLAGSVMDARASLNRRMQDLEDNGSIYNLLFSGAIDAKDRKWDERYEKDPTTGLAVNVATFKDKRGHDMYFYLQGIYDEVYRLRNAVGGGFGGGGSYAAPYGNGRQFKELASKTVGDKPSKPNAKQRYMAAEASADMRYREDIARFVEEGGNLYDLYDGDQLKNIVNSLSEDLQIKARQNMMESQNTFQRALYRQHFTQDELNAKREKLNKDPLVGGVVDRFKQATLTEKLQMAISGLNRAAAAPSEMAEKLINKADARIYEFFYGAETGEQDETGKDIKGMIGLMTNRFNAEINKVTTFLDEKVFGKIKNKLGIEEWADILDKIGVKDFFESMSSKLFGDKDSEGKRSGGIVGNFIQDTKDAIKNKTNIAWNWVKDSAKEVTSPITDKFKSAFKPKDKKITGSDLDNLDLADSPDLVVHQNKVVKLDNASRLVKASKDATAHNKILLRLSARIYSYAKNFKEIQTDMTTGRNRWLFDPVILANLSVEDVENYISLLAAFLSNYKHGYAFKYISEENPEKIVEIFDLEDKSVAELKKVLPELADYINKNEIDKMIAKTEEASKTLKDRLMEKCGKVREDGLTAFEARKREMQRKKALADRTSFLDIPTVPSATNRYDGFDFGDAGKEEAKLNKFIDKYFPIFCKQFKIGKDKALQSNIRSILMLIYDSEERDNINSLSASKIYEIATVNGFSNLAIHIDKVMTSYYGNRDFDVSGFGSSTQGVIPSGTAIFDRSAEILEKIYNLLIVSLPKTNMTTDNDRLDRIINRTDTVLSRSIARKTARESETAGEDSHQDEPPGVAAGGGYFRKSGLSALSEGEIYGRNGLYGKVPKTGVYDVKAGTIIYPTKRNKAIELAKEQKAISGYIKTNAAANDGETVTRNGVTYSKAKMNGKDVWIHVDDKTGEVSILEESLIDKAINKIESTAGQVRSAYTGTPYTGVKINNTNPKQLAAEIRKAAPEITAGAALGAAAGLLVGNPMLGAALGGAMSFTSGSETAKKWLFGEQITDADGNITGRAGGIISKSVQDTFKKYAPNISSHAMVGGALGLLTPFGLVGGTLLGAAAGYVKSSDDAKLMLFGDATDPDSGIVSKNMRDKIAKMAPNLAVGALGGMFLGPFGLVGNAVLGSGLGFLSTTEDFKRTVLGEPLKIGPNGEEVRVGGLVGVIRDDIIEPIKNWGINFIDKTEAFLTDKVFKPLARSFDPIVTEILHAGKGLGSFITNSIKSILDTELGMTLAAFTHKALSPVKKVAGTASKVAGTVARGTILAPVTAISTVGESLRRKQVAGGYANYMTAQERLDYRNSIPGSFIRSKLGFGIKGDGSLSTIYRKDKALETDRTLVSLDSEQLDKAADIVKTLSASKNFYKKTISQKSKAIVTLLNEYFDGKVMKSMLTACRNNRWQTVLDLINTATPKDITKFDINTKRALMEKVSNLMAEYDAANAAKSMTEADRKSMFENLRKLGFTNINEKNLDSLYYGITKQKSLTEAKEATKTEDEKNRENANENANKIIDALEEIKNAILLRELPKDSPLRQELLKKVNDTLPPKEAAAVENTAQASEAENTDVDNTTTTNKASTDIAGTEGLRLRRKNALFREYYDSDSNSIRTFRKTFNGWKEISNKASKDANRNEDKDQEKQAGLIATAMSKIPFFNKKEEEKDDKKKKGIVSRLFGAIAKGAKGVGGYIKSVAPIAGLLGGAGIAAVTGIAAAGHLGNFIETKALPTVKNYWENKVSPWLEEKLGGRLERIVDGIKSIPSKIQNAITGAFTWLGKNADKVLTWYSDGITYFGGYLEKATTFIVSNLWPIMKGIVKNVVWPGIKGIFKGVLNWFSSKDNKSYEDRVNPAVVNIGFDEPNKHITEANKAAARLGINSSLSTTSPITLDVEDIPDGGNTGLVTKDQANAYRDLETQFKGAKTEADKAKVLEQVKQNAYVGQVTTDTGNTVNYRDNAVMMKDKLGNTIITDNDGNVVNTNDKTGKTSTVGYIANRALRSVLTGNKGILGIGAKIGGAALDFGGMAMSGTGKIMSKIPGFKLLGKATSGVGKVASVTGNLVENAGIAWNKLPTGKTLEATTDTVLKKGSVIGNLIQKVLGFLGDVLRKIFTNNKVNGLITKFMGKLSHSNITGTLINDKIETMVLKLMTGLDDMLGAAAKASTSVAGKIGSILKKAGPWIMVATGVWDFVTGWQNANTILGLADSDAIDFEITYTHRFLTGLLKTVNGLCLGIIPEDKLMDWIIKNIMPIFTDTKELEKARKDSEEFIAQLNSEEGTDYTIESYNNRNKWTTKVLNYTKKTSKDLLDLFTYDDRTNNTTVYKTKYTYAKDGAYVTRSGKGKYGTGRAYQRDPRYANIPFNRNGDRLSQTIGDSGCGPAAAVNAVNYAYGTGNDLLTAAGVAKNYKELNGGTKPEFFDKYFKDNGLKANRLSGSEIEDSLRGGNPVVLMGKDRKGGLGTPYGPNPHYITAKGIDRNNNIIVDDPESPIGTAIYNKNRVLGHSSIAIGASRYGGSKYGMGTNIEANKQIIWSFLKSKGYNDIAASAIMGNIAKECSYDYSLTESGGKGPGVGICQWTYKTRKNAFLSAVPDWKTNLMGQLNFMWNEINSSYKKVLPENLNRAASVNEAVGIFHDVYEQSNDRNYYGNLSHRENFASQAYTQFTGTTPVNLPAYTSTSGVNTTNANTGYSDSKLGQLGKYFSDLFRSALAAEYGDTAIGAIFGSGSGNCAKYGKGITYGSVRVTKIYSMKTGKVYTVDATIPADKVERHTSATKPDNTKYTIEGNFGWWHGTQKGYITKDIALEYAIIPKEDIGYVNGLNYTKSANIRGRIEGNNSIRTSVLSEKEKLALGFSLLSWKDMPYDSMLMKSDAPTKILTEALQKSGITIPITQHKKTVGALMKQYFNVNMDDLVKFANSVGVYADFTLEQLQTQDSALYNKLKKYAKAVLDIDTGKRNIFTKVLVGDICNKLGFKFSGERIAPASMAGSTDSADPNAIDYTISNTTNTSSTSGIGSIFDLIKSAFFSAFDYVDKETGEKRNLLSLIGLGPTTSNSNTTYNTEATVGTTSTTAGVTGSTANNFPWYNQSDPQWGTIPYGKSGTISSSGCGPTSMAMILKSFGNNVTPKDTAAWSQSNGYRVENKGTAWGYFNSQGNKYGLTTQQSEPSANFMLNNLRKGYPMISSMKPGDFTKSGHFIVLSGIDNNGNILVNDGAGNNGMARTARTWTPDNIVSQSKQMWAFNKGGIGSIGGYSNMDSTTGMGSANVSKGYVSSPFDDPTRYSHNGVDISAPKGEPIVSTVNGEVIRSEYNETNGNMVVIRDGQGRLHTFSHLLSPGPKVGTRISSGSVIGYVGNTGKSYGDHLHVSVTDKDGQFVDPISKRRAANNRPIGGSSGIDYTMLIKAVIEVLATIANNTAKVDQLIRLLTTIANPTNTQTAAVNTPATKSDVSVKQTLSNILGKQEYASILKSGDVSSIVDIMSQIALD